MRLFIAICFTPAFRQAVRETGQALYRQLGGGQLIPPENFHLTLAFLGETDRLAQVKDVMRRIPGEKLNLALGQIGSFRQKDSDLYWVGLQENRELVCLADTLSESLRQTGFDLPGRAFQPHITLIRKAPAGKNAVVSVPKAEMTADRISLMKSERIGGRMVYTEIFKQKLGG